MEGCSGNAQLLLHVMLLNVNSDTAVVSLLIAQ